MKFTNFILITFFLLISPASFALDLYEKNEKKTHLKVFEYDYYKTLKFPQDKSILAFTAIGFGETGVVNNFVILYQNQDTTQVFPFIFHVDNRGPYAIKFSLEDLDKDGNPELILRYMIGVRIHVLKVFTIKEGEFPKLWQNTFEGESYEPLIIENAILCIETSLSDPEVTITKYRINKASSELLERKKISKNEFLKMKKDLELK